MEGLLCSATNQIYWVLWGKTSFWGIWSAIRALYMLFTCTSVSLWGRIGLQTVSLVGLLVQFAVRWRVRFYRLPFCEVCSAYIFRSQWRGPSGRTETAEVCRGYTEVDGSCILIFFVLQQFGICTAYHNNTHLCNGTILQVLVTINLFDQFGGNA